MPAVVVLGASNLRANPASRRDGPYRENSFPARAQAREYELEASRRVGWPGRGQSRVWPRRHAARAPVNPRPQVKGDMQPTGGQPCLGRSASATPPISADHGRAHRDKRRSSEGGALTIGTRVSLQEPICSARAKLQSRHSKSLRPSANSLLFIWRPMHQEFPVTFFISGAPVSRLNNTF